MEDTPAKGSKSAAKSSKKRAHDSEDEGAARSAKVRRVPTTTRRRLEFPHTPCHPSCRANRTRPHAHPPAARSLVALRTAPQRARADSVDSAPGASSGAPLYIAPIAVPLAGPKLGKRVHKVVKKGAWWERGRMRGM